MKIYCTFKSRFHGNRTGTACRTTFPEFLIEFSIQASFRHVAEKAASKREKLLGFLCVCVGKCVLETTFNYFGQHNLLN